MLLSKERIQNGDQVELYDPLLAIHWIQRKLSKRYGAYESWDLPLQKFLQREAHDIITAWVEQDQLGPMRVSVIGYSDDTFEPKTISTHWVVEAGMSRAHRLATGHILIECFRKPSLETSNSPLHRAMVTELFHESEIL